MNNPCPDAAPDQNHPLHAIDRRVVDALLAAESPAEEHLIDAARLLNRYDGFPGAADLRDDLERVLRHWKLNRDILQRRTRELWKAGYRPGGTRQGEAVGSGFDTAGGE